MFIDIKTNSTGRYCIEGHSLQSFAYIVKENGILAEEMDMICQSSILAAMNRLYTAMRDCDYIVAWYAGFVKSMLMKTTKQIGHRFRYRLVNIMPKFVCLMTLTKHMVGKRHKLCFGYRDPLLTELYLHVFKNEAELNSLLTRVIAMNHITSELTNKGLISLTTDSTQHRPRTEHQSFSGDRTRDRVGSR